MKEEQSLKFSYMSPPLGPLLFPSPLWLLRQTQTLQISSPSYSTLKLLLISLSLVNNSKSSVLTGNSLSSSIDFNCSFFLVVLGLYTPTRIACFAEVYSRF